MCDLILEIAQRSSVLQSNAGTFFFFMDGHLGFFAGYELFFGPAALPGALQTLVPWRFDEDNFIAF
jgi:hypothetical protein